MLYITMNQFIICLLLSFAITVLLIPFAKRVSLRFGAVSDIGGRHVGNQPIARLGGFAVLIGVILSIIFTMINNSPLSLEMRAHKVELFGSFTGLIVVGGIGLFDDFRRAPAVLKLFMQVIGAALAYGSGLKITELHVPYLDHVALGWLSFPATLGWIILVVNAINLIDGLDGLAGGIMLFGSIAIFVSSLQAGALVQAAIMASIAGAVSGFLIFNWYPARIYLGDCGAYSLGFLLSISALMPPSQKSTTGAAIIVPIISLGIPLLDTIATIIRRAFRGQRVFSPDRGHIHHLLLDAGISHKSAVVGLWLVSCLLGSIAVTLNLNNKKLLGLCTVGIFLISGAVWARLVIKRIRKSL